MRNRSTTHTRVHESYPCACGLVLKQVTDDSIAAHLSSAKHKGHTEKPADKQDHTCACGKVMKGVGRPGGGCTGCVGVNIACTPRWCKERGDFWSQPPSLPPPLSRGQTV